MEYNLLSKKERYYELTGSENNLSLGLASTQALPTHE